MRTRYMLFKSDTEPIVIIMVILLVTGTINVFSSSYVLAAMDFEDPYYFLCRHLQWLGLGTVACYICRKVDYQKRRMSILFVACIVIGMLILVLLTGRTVNGAQRWLEIGSFVSFQPAEFAKLMSVL